MMLLVVVLVGVILTDAVPAPFSNSFTKHNTQQVTQNLVSQPLVTPPLSRGQVAPNYQIHYPEMDVPWCDDYQTCGQGELCTTPTCPHNYTCCKSLDGVCCLEQTNTPRITRNLQPSPHPSRLPPIPLTPQHFKFPYTIPITENKITIPIPLPKLNPNGSLDYNVISYYPFVLNLADLNIPNFQPSNLVLNSLTATPGRPKDTNEYTPTPYTDDRLLTPSSYPFPTRYPERNPYPSDFNLPATRYYQYEPPRYSAVEYPSSGGRYPVSQNRRVDPEVPVYSPPQFEKLERMQPVPSYEMPSNAPVTLVNPLTGERIVRLPIANLPRTYRSSEPSPYDKVAPPATLYRYPISI